MNQIKIGKFIADCRKEKNLTQEELAEKIGVSRQVVTKWESDIGLPDIENLKAIATLFNISIEFAFGLAILLFSENSS